MPHYAGRLLKSAAFAALALIALAWLLGCGYAPPQASDKTTSASAPHSAKVFEIVDVDVVRVVSEGKGEKVRLVGLMPPPPGSPLRDQAKQKLAEMVRGRSVELQFDEPERDEQGRLMAYLFLDGKMVNAELVRLGYARVDPFPSHVGESTRYNEIRSAAIEASENKRGMWATYTPDGSGLPFTLAWHSPEGPGADLNDEWLEIRGKTTSLLTDYVIQNFRGEAYTGPDLRLAPGQTVRLRTGAAGESNPSDIYLGASAFMWNVPQPGGGIGGAYAVFDPEGHLLYEKSWLTPGDANTEVPASSSTSLNPSKSLARYEDLDGPLLVAPGKSGDVVAKWRELSAVAVEVKGGDDGWSGGDETAPVVVPGFQLMNYIALADGRFIVRGIWSGDEPIAIWYKSTAGTTLPGGQEDSPVSQEAIRPVRLFVYDPATKDIKPVSHVPKLRAYDTASNEGESPDTVLGIMLLPGEKVVAYTSGFAGGAYQNPYELYVAPIPPPAS